MGAFQALSCFPFTADWFELLGSRFYSVEFNLVSQQGHWFKKQLEQCDPCFLGMLKRDPESQECFPLQLAKT